MKLILVRCVLELTVRQNLHFFYQYRCYIANYFIINFILALTHVLSDSCVKTYCKSFNNPDCRVFRTACWISRDRWFDFLAYAHILIINFSLTSRCLEHSEDHANEIKHDVHPE